jgi:hypothetical protein
MSIVDDTYLLNRLNALTTHIHLYPYSQATTKCADGCVN